MRFPRKIEEIHQIELSSRCNLKCVYCPNEKMHRPKGFISDYHFEKALEICVELERRGTQQEVWMHGLGESLLHPKVLDMCEAAIEALPNTYVKISTNALLLTQEMIDRFKEMKIIMHISLHDPVGARNGHKMAKDAGILEFVGCNPIVTPTNWAGQVDWDQVEAPAICGWLKLGWAIVQADGQIVTCCLDAGNYSVVGTVDDDLDTLGVKPYALRKTCHMITDF